MENINSRRLRTRGELITGVQPLGHVSLVYADFITDLIKAAFHLTISMRG